MSYDIAVVGSAHLDILSTVASGVGTIDKPGHLTIHVGGCAYNLAVNIAAMGSAVCFISAFNPSSFSKMIVSEIEGHDITVEPVYDPALPDSGFSAHIYNSDIQSAVSCIALGDYDFPLTDGIAEIIRNSKHLFLECNMTVESINRFSQFAKDHGVPVSLGLVSEEKALKFQYIKNVDYVFCNFREYSHLMNHGNDWNPSEEYEMYVTMGRRGAMCYKGINPIANASPNIVNDPVSLLGAGDGFAAGVINEKITNPGKSIEQQMLDGCSVASTVITRYNCNLGKHDIINKKLNELENKAYRDKLTNILNREGASVVFRKVNASAANYTVLMFDIDHFKSVNDTYGHDVGDDVIRFVAVALQETLRDTDYAIRWGGEEIIGIMNCDLDVALTVANRVGMRISSARNIGPNGEVEKITVSMGVFPYIPGKIAIEQAITQADELLYVCKKAGRNCMAYKESPGDEPVIRQYQGVRTKEPV